MDEDGGGPRAARAPRIDPALAQARPARDARGIRHLLGRPPQAAQGQEPAHGPADERLRGTSPTLQAVEGVEARGPLTDFLALPIAAAKMVGSALRNSALRRPTRPPRGAGVGPEW